MLLENNSNYSTHLQRSIDTLRSLGDRLGERNVDLRLNLHHNGEPGRIHHHQSSPHHQPPSNPALELNLSLNGDRLLQEKMAQAQEQRSSLERLINERTMHQHQHQHDQRLSMEHGLGLERLNLERSLVAQQQDRNGLGGGGGERGLMERNLNANMSGSYQGGQGEVRHPDINELKYREYKSHIDHLRESRSLEGRHQDDDRGGTNTPSTPPTPISVGENFQEEKVFGSKAELQLHTQAHMREAKPYKCSQCCKAFANSSYLSQHTRIHLGIKPYRCEICQRKFTQLSHLQQHIRTHTGDKPYKCRHPGCQKAFSQLSNLQSHSRCHQTDKPYKCNSCYKCFSDEPSLLEHIPKHKESKHLKTHICQYCGKSYTQETYLSKHMQKHAERTDKRPPIGPVLGLNHRTPLDHPYWPKVSPDSASDLHDYPPSILDQNEDLVIIRQQLQQQPPNQGGGGQHPAPPPTPNGHPHNPYDSIKTASSSAFTPINSMAMGLNHHPQLGGQRGYIYDALGFQKQAEMPKGGGQGNGFPNQLISLHQIRNYAHQPGGLMDHGILGGLKDK